MPLPPSVTRIKKDGVEFVSSVDRCAYTIRELVRAALRDVGKYVLRGFRIHPAYLHQKRVPALAGTLFWWRRVDSNHRSDTQQIYSLPHLATLELLRLELVDGLEPPTC